MSLKHINFEKYKTVPVTYFKKFDRVADSFDIINKIGGSWALTKHGWPTCEHGNLDLVIQFLDENCSGEIDKRDGVNCDKGNITAVFICEEDHDKKFRSEHNTIKESDFNNYAYYEGIIVYVSRNSFRVCEPFTSGEHLMTDEIIKFNHTFDYLPLEDILLAENINMDDTSEIDSAYAELRWKEMSSKIGGVINSTQYDPKLKHEKFGKHVVQLNSDDIPFLHLADSGMAHIYEHGNRFMFEWDCY